MGQFASLREHQFSNFEELGSVVADAPRKIIQLGRGPLRGRTSHLTVAGMFVDRTTFNVGLKSKGTTTNRDRFSISLLTSSQGCVSRSSFASRPGDILVTPPEMTHENIYHGGASLTVISMTAGDIEESFRGEGELADSSSWVMGHHRGIEETTRRVSTRLQTFFDLLGKPNDLITAEIAHFWKLSIIEAIAQPILTVREAERDRGPPSSLSTINRVEEFLDARGNAPVHLSEICAQLNIRRRSLHRIFHDTLGVGPATYLRHRRLCSVHSLLQSREHADSDIAALAMQFGFFEIGRFCTYYRRLFGETPSETRGYRLNWLSGRRARA